MNDAALTEARILDAAEEVLRRHGPAKANVVDVARALGVSHGSVYRHFPSKAALRDAVMRRWLAQIMTPLRAIAASPGPAPARLHRWLATLAAEKRRLVLKDPELFATYGVLAEDARDVVAEHVAAMAENVERILLAGVADGDFAVTDPSATARAVLHATSWFHHPAHAATWHDKHIDKSFETVWQLLLQGLTHNVNRR